MSAMSQDRSERPINGRACWLDEEMAELLFLLPSGQTAEMERLASSRRLTLGQLIRVLIRDYLADPARPDLASHEPGRQPGDASGGPFRLPRKGATIMSHTALTPFESTIQTTNVWLNEVVERLGWHDHNRGYHALRAVLHALRDRLPVEQAAALAAQLPMLVRGFYYEGWHPHGKPVKERHKEAFLAHVAEAFRDDPDVDPEGIVRAVFRVLSKHVSGGEIDSMKRSLPTEIRSLWD